MFNQATLAERVAFGRPLDLEENLAIHVAPRPATMLLGRVFLATIFLVSGIAKLMNTGETAGYMAAQGIPAASTLAIVAGIAEILGGLSIFTGFLTRIGALGLILFLIPTTFLFHDFWNFSGTEHQMQMVNFLKNLAIMGGLSLLVAQGAGRYSIDAKIRKPIEA